jgi:hypothetical protein
VFYGYGYRWLRTKDDMTVQGLWPRSDAIRRQLLGAGTNATECGPLAPGSCWPPGCREGPGGA